VSLEVSSLKKSKDHGSEPKVIKVSGVVRNLLLNSDQESGTRDVIFHEKIIPRNKEQMEILIHSGGNLPDLWNRKHFELGIPSKLFHRREKHTELRNVILNHSAEDKYSWIFDPNHFIEKRKTFKIL
jgi:hypothetical protein